MLLSDVVAASVAVAATTSRTAKTAAVARALVAAAAEGPATVEVVAAYLSGVLPQRRIGVAWRGLQDLPAPAHDASLSVTDVDGAAEDLARLSGPGSAGRRAAIVRALFARATAAEQRWLAGLLTGETRQGAADGVLLQAIARAADVPDEAVRRAVMLAGHAGPVARAALTGGGPALEAITLEVGRPLRPMLAGAAPDVATALATIPGEVAVETKLDGIRLQAHVEDGTVALYTRTLEDVTDRMPEITEALAALPVRRAVLDGEVVALRPDGRPEPFQVTGARTASSADPARLRREVPLTPYFFDVLHLDGADLLDAPAAARWDRLVATVPPGWLVARTTTADVGAAEAFFARQVAAGHEGVVVKDLRVPYAAGRRGAGWVKVKPRHTLDLVVLAVEWGSGRRHGWLSNIHLGARDATTGQLVMLGKTFKGMTDEMLRWQTVRFLTLETSRSGHVVHVRPEQVVEIAFDGVQRSTRYPGGMALRFARVVRYRDDKPVEEVDTTQTVRALAGW
ncbi:MAG TPA: ATP-dependent DNA ligase [Intrasporangium sp.]|uniref:ATP-dependent DNA ligase n=1 Tax=Intrasporangium sp. TaxID=1925024 RepID=UPI002D798D3E|nr:ATP-dependent DNA ligase [Intrasporangium sp.]HET7397881.1 ATP-dependent DNA ligase [Intrasporangium sp.]